MLVGKKIREDYIQKFCPSGKDDIRVFLASIVFGALKDRGFRAVLLYRIGRYFRVHGRNLLAAFVDRLIHRLCFCEISTTADIGPGFRVFHPFGLVVGTNVRAGKNFTLSMDVVLGGNVDKRREDGTSKPIIGNNVNIAAGCKVVGPINIGDNCLIGANSVVISSLPSDSVAAGVPARIIRQQGQRINLLKNEGELYDILRELITRVEKLEEQIAREGENSHIC